MLEPRYKTGPPVIAGTLAELLQKLPLDTDRAMAILAQYNASAGEGRFDPTLLDGLATDGLDVDKTNWAQTLDTPPFRAYPVTG